MSESIQLGEVSITVTLKDVKNVHLSVHPPDGYVTLVAPSNTRLEVARAYAISKLSWIRQQQKKLAGQARETSRQFIERESHHVWGRRYLMTVHYQNCKPSVVLGNKRMTLSVRPDCSAEKRAEVMHEWHKTLLHDAVPPLIQKWEQKFKVRVSAYYLQRMKTRWGSCNYRAHHIRLNSDLASYPPHCLEYVVVHELVHLLEPSHNQRFYALMTQFYPDWPAVRAQLRHGGEC
jgi:predicted metal-dependent hydrolase